MLVERLLFSDDLAPILTVSWTLRFRQGLIEIQRSLSHQPPAGKGSERPDRVLGLSDRAGESRVDKQFPSLVWAVPSYLSWICDCT